MPIRDAIQEGNTEHEIFFLLTAYIEALSFCDKLNLLPWQMRELPLAGAADVKARYDSLRPRLHAITSDAESGTRHVIEEALTVFSTALRRLAFLKADGSLPHAA